MALPYYTFTASPLGELLLVSSGEALQGLYLMGQKYFPAVGPDWRRDDRLALFLKAIEQLEAYFQHQRQTFDLPLQPQGTDFQRRVWQQLPLIPYGATISYGELARRVGQPQAARAVGAANGRNPIAIVIPCHRVVAQSGKMQGYAGGIARKQWLLRHEQVETTADLSPSDATQLSLL